MSAPTVQYSARETLTVRTELIRQVRRRRSLVAVLLVIALPLIVVVAVKFGPSSGGGGGFGDGDLDLVGLATSGAWNFTLTMLLFSSSFLLIVIAALFLGDTVASEASWGTLRYLLVAPVPRRKLLRTKVIVGVLLTYAVLLVLVIASWIIGAIAFGVEPLANPLGGVITTTQSLERVLIITAYIAVTLLFPAGIAFLMSVLTDVPLGAVGTAVILVIVLNIIDAIDALGDLRRLLPTEYGSAWVGVLNPVISWDQMVIGAAYSVAAFALFVGIAFVWFERKDITS